MVFVQERSDTGESIGAKKTFGELKQMCLDILLYSYNKR